MLADLRVLEFEVVLECINIHEAYDGDTVLLENEVLLIEVDQLYQGPEMDAGLDDRETVKQR